MEGFSAQRHEQQHHSYCHPHEALLAGFHGCTNLDDAAAAGAAAAAMASECSTSSPSLSMAMQQPQGSFPPSLGAEPAGGGGGDKERRMVSIERSSTTTSLGSAHEIAGSGGSSSRRHKRSNNGSVAAGVKGKRAGRGHGVDAKAEEEAAAAGYIHVRARRGQATDSHSVAERLRRERINEKMKMLQSLVPGCDKLAGKALLDEIISYVQSLQSQVEFLSMKLATVNPAMQYELGLDMGGMCGHPDAPQVLKTAEMLPHEEAVQWMGQAAAAASASASLAAEAEDGRSSRVNVLQLQRQQQEEEELSNMTFFQH